uniref:Small ribosomal subunit protein bS6m n=1 Tax=Zosterops lateralis melanops TaxID=1220523 RepID=A0A8D2PAP6_ZOSLA
MDLEITGDFPKEFPAPKTLNASTFSPCVAAPALQMRPETAAVLKRTVEALMERGAVVRNLENLGERSLPYKISKHKEQILRLIFHSCSGGILCQGLITLKRNNFFPISHLNFPHFNGNPFPVSCPSIPCPQSLCSSPGAPLGPARGSELSLELLLSLLQLSQPLT